jgi:hypothetical protein
MRPLVFICGAGALIEKTAGRELSGENARPASIPSYRGDALNGAFDCPMEYR